MQPERTRRSSPPSPRSRRRLAAQLAAALAVVGASAAGAAAQSYGDFDFDVGIDYGTYFDSLECPTPDASYCLDAVYQESECGRAAIAAGQCQLYIEEALEAAPTTRVGFAQIEDGSYRFGAMLPSAPTSGDYDYGVGASYLSELGQFAAEQRNVGLASWIYWKDPATSRRAAWDSNGHRVATCEELAYEGWYTYSRFEDEAARRGADARAIFDAARATGFGATKIRARDGDLPWIGRNAAEVPALPFPTAPIAKNAYFRFEPSAFDGDMIPAELIPAAEGREFYAGDWAWHLAMDDHFRGWGYGEAIDDVLDGEYERQQKFVKLLARRAKILEALAGGSSVATVDRVSRTGDRVGFTPSTGTDALDGLTSDDPLVYTGGYTGDMGRLWAVNQLIIQELQHAQDMGCLDTGVANTCDWSPRIFADMVGEAYVKQREEEYQRCLQLTGNDFSDGSPLGNPTAFGLPAIDYRASAGTVRMFLNAYEDSLETLDFTPEPGAPSTPSVGWWRDGGRWLGNGDFGAGYSYKFGFGLVRAEEAGACVVNFEAAATANASAVVAGQSLSLLDSDTRGVTVAANAFRVTSHTTLLGKYSLYEPIDRTYTSPEPSTPWHIEKEWGASAMFWIGPVPVTGTIGVAGQAGLRIEAGVTMDRNCYDTPRLHVSGGFTATPYVQASAFIGALIGARGLGAGLRTDLQLANIAAPLTVSAEIHGTGTDLAKLVASTTATVTVDLGLTIDSLGGTVSGVVETPFKTWRKTLFAWEGKRLVDEHWRRSWRLPIARLLPLLGS